MAELEIIIDTNEIRKFFFEELVNRGYAPGDDEIDEIANIVFDFMVYKGIIEEEFDLED